MQAIFFSVLDDDNLSDKVQGIFFFKKKVQFCFEEAYQSFFKLPSGVLLNWVSKVRIQNFKMMANIGQSLSTLPDRKQQDVNIQHYNICLFFLKSR